MVLTEGHLSPIFLDLRTYDEPKEMGVECGRGYLSPGNALG